MKRLHSIAREKISMRTVVELTQVFESIASLKISQVRNQVLESQKFFEELWRIYRQLRVDSLFRFGRSQSQDHVSDKELYIIITAEGGFSGDIDEKLIQWMRQTYKPETHDIIVIGHHGAVQLAQAGVSFKRYFRLPQHDQNLNLLPIIQEVQQYRSSVVYYQTYISLMVQDVKRISLGEAVQEHGRNIDDEGEIISEETYIFEPSTFAVVDHLERSMLQITLSQVILESKLAQYASRFRAMTLANDKADEALSKVSAEFNRAKRARKDEQLKEIVSALQKSRLAV